MRAFEHDGREIAIYNCAGQLYATDAICTHEYANLSEGWLDIDDCSIECPLHGARYDIATGHVLALPAVQPLQIFEVRVEDGEVLVGIPA